MYQRAREFVGGLYNTLSSLGETPGEHLVFSLRRRVLILGSVLMSFGGLLWGVLCIIIGARAAAIIPFSYTGLTVISLTYLWYVKNVSNVQTFQTAISLALPFALQAALGGFVQSGAMMLWAMISIVGAFTFTDRRQATVWLVVYLALTLFSGFVDQEVRSYSTIEMSDDSKTFALTINILLVSAIVFGLAIYHNYTREEAIMALLEERETSRALLETLAQTERNASQEAEWMGLFLAKMSHEIRTPISAILGITDIALQGGAGVISQALLRKVDLVARHLLSLTENLLDIFKISGGHMTLESQPFSLQEMVGSLKTLTLVRPNRGNVKVIFSIDPHLPKMVVGDALRIRQVIINFLSNSLKFTQTGQIVLSITVVDVPQSYGTVTVAFSVSDSGVGMTRAQLERLFLPFTQADTSVARRFGGTGLGLSIAMEIVSALQSEVHVESVAGEGSTFSFQLDLLLPTEESFSKTPTAEPLSSTFRTCSARRIILITDNETERAALSAYCLDIARATDMTVHCYATIDGWVAEGGRFDDYDVVFLDDGQLREHPQVHAELARGLSTTDMQIHLLTNDSKFKNVSIDGRVLESLVRPVLPEDLIDCIRRAPQSGERSDAGSHSTAAGRLPRTRVLVVEDNEIIRTTIATRLEMAGAAVVQAENGQEAIDRVNSDPTIEILLMDVQMPVLDGLQATRAMRAAGVTLPIIGLSAGGMPEDRTRAFAAGMDEHLIKPVEPEELIAKVASLTHVMVQPSFSGYGSSERTSSPGGLDFVNTERGPLRDMSNSSLPVFDREALLRRLGGKDSLIPTLLQRFISEHADDSARVDSAACQRNFDEVRFITHRLKGAARTLGAMEIGQAAEVLEDLAVEQRDNPAVRAALRNALIRFNEDIGTT